MGYTPKLEVHPNLGYTPARSTLRSHRALKGLREKGLRYVVQTTESVLRYSTDNHLEI